MMATAPNAARRNAQPRYDRARLDVDTDNLLTDYGQAVQLAAIGEKSTAAALEWHDALAAASMVRPRRPGDLTGRRAARNYPVSGVLGKLRDADAARALAVKRIATAAAATYAEAALRALSAVLCGESLSPSGLEADVAAMELRPRPDFSTVAAMPAHGPHHRPALPELHHLTTGHADLDGEVAAAYADLAFCYQAAEALERAADPSQPVQAHDDAEGAEDLASMLGMLLTSFADAVAEAARYGHADPHTVITAATAPA